MNSTPEYGPNGVAACSWHKSSYSGGDGGDCLEFTRDLDGIAPVRDSKNPTGPKLKFRADAWSAFVADLRRTA
ncbi:MULTISPECIES: DUF397 domain-containing protein [unclassified Streptomyces]|uniref:DUF397 domain-containing protein n=1 Tax=unclassified Streptomyces TaxID=2593676 RepID=UPI00278C1D66|nr:MULTISPECIES: DUF397 domain-containing protein [unclassified Streptomyces]